MHAHIFIICLIIIFIFSITFFLTNSGSVDSLSISPAIPPAIPLPKSQNIDTTSFKDIAINDVITIYSKNKQILIDDKIISCDILILSKNKSLLNPTKTKILGKNKIKTIHLDKDINDINLGFPYRHNKVSYTNVYIPQ